MSFALRTAREALRLSIPLGFALVTLRHLAELRAWPSFSELTYLGGLASVLGLGVGLACTLFSALARRTPERTAWVALGLAAVSTPWAHAAGRYLARSDTVVRRDLPGHWVQAGVFLSVIALVLGFWQVRRRPPRSRRARVFAGTLLAAIAGAELVVGRHHALLVPVLYGAGLGIGLTLVQGARTSEARVASRTWACASIAVLGLSLGGLVRPDLRALGRAAVHRRTPSLAHLDTRLGLATDHPNIARGLQSGPPTVCASDPTPPMALALTAAQRRNVIIITIDTVRTDVAFSRLHGRTIMPELSRFVHESWRAREAYTPYPATMMALSSAFSGLMPSRLVLSNGAPPSLFGALASVIDERVVLLPSTPYFRRAAIEDYIAQGATRLTASSAKVQTDLAIERLRTFRKKGKRHLVWLHYFEPHAPYKRDPHHDFGSAAKERYASELALVDREFGRFLRVLREGGWYDDSLVMVFADHGESFGEHGHAHHHYHLFPWLIRVPLAMHVPGQAPKAFEGPVHLTDVAATVLHYAGVRPSLALDGQSLLAGSPAADRTILAEEFPVQMVALGEYVRTDLADRAQLAERVRDLEQPRGYPSKIAVVRGHEQFVLSRGSGVTELYDLRADPGVSENLVSARPRRAALLHGELEAYLGRASAQAGCVVAEPRASR